MKRKVSMPGHGHCHKQGAGKHDPRPRRLRSREAVRRAAIRDSHHV